MDCLLFYVKYPERGKVKSRLAHAIGEWASVELYRAFVQDLARMLSYVKVDVRVCFSPEKARGKVVEWLGPSFSYVPQVGVDLGERLKASFEEAFEEYDRVIVIGSDSPDLPLSFLQDALKALATHDVVIGPASDGGYYLIGFSRGGFDPSVFDDIDWSTERVFAQTRQRLRGRVHVLPVWHDVDTLEDLKALVERNQGTEFDSSDSIQVARRVL